MSKSPENGVVVDISELTMKDIQTWNESIVNADIRATNIMIVRVVRVNGESITEETLGNMKPKEWKEIVRAVGGEITAIFQTA